jgi:membrane associated rhomboid family serine protease
MRRGAFYDDFPATSILLLVIFSFYAIEVLYTQRATEEDLLKSAMAIDTRVLGTLGATSMALLRKGEVWRLIAAAFLHGGIFHLLMNSWVLADLGRVCEPLLSAKRFTVVYVVSAIGGALGSAAGHALRGHASIPSVGASGALLGLIGLLLGFSIRHRDQMLRDEMVRWILYMVLLSILGGSTFNIDHYGHAGGFLTGGLFGFFTPRYVSSRAARFWKIPFWGCCLATAAALGFALWNHFSAWRA